MSDRVCPSCHGTRLRPASRAVTVAGKTIIDVMSMSVKACLAFFLKIADGADSADVADVESRRLTAPSSSSAKSASSSGPALSATDRKVVADVLKEIVKRLRFLNDV